MNEVLKDPESRYLRALPSRKGSESARSIQSGRLPTSVLFQVRTAETAVSWPREQVEKIAQIIRMIHPLKIHIFCFVIFVA